MPSYTKRTANHGIVARHMTVSKLKAIVMNQAMQSTLKY